jgi:hypothetical protein
MTPKKSLESVPARQATRRSVIKAAAWSAPVIAIAATAPLAAASPTNPSLVKYGTGTAVITPSNPTVGTPVDVEFRGLSFNLLNITGSWDTGLLVFQVNTNTVGLTGAIFTDGAGTPLISGSSVPASDGRVFTVVDPSIANFTLTAPGRTVSAADGNVAIPFPTLHLRGTYVGPKGRLTADISTTNIPGTVAVGGNVG